MFYTNIYSDQIGSYVLSIFELLILIPPNYKKSKFDKFYYNLL
jgi:hypothetical protein